MTKRGTTWDEKLLAEIRQPSFQQKFFCPPYFNLSSGVRAYLTLNACVDGTWSAGYIVWYRNTEVAMDGFDVEHSRLVGPAINNAPDPAHALAALNVALREENPREWA